MDTRGTRVRAIDLPRAAAAVLLAFSALGGRLEAAWVIISEIHYAPPRGEPLEFIEIWTGDPPRVDLSGWTIDGDASFRFPRGTVLLPDECLVVARDPAALRARYPSLEGEEGRVLGPFQGTLGKTGGRIALRDAAGALQCEVPYRDRGKWPAAAGGTGHTLVIADPMVDPAEPESWRTSAVPGGTPGSTPELRAPEREKGLPIVRQGEVWSFFRGQVDPPAGWRDLDFDDSGWESGPSGFGFSDGDDATEVADMEGAYLTLYTRRAFTVADPSKLERLILLADFDDGFIATLNGREVARANMPPGPATHDTPAPATHESGTPSEFPIGRASDLLQPGRNVLAVEVHNRSLSSTDVTLIVELESRAPRESGSRRPAPGIVINEVLPGDEGYVELFHPGPSPLKLDGWSLSDDPANLARKRLGEGLVVEAGGFLTLGKKELGDAIRIQGPELFLALSRPDGGVADAVRLDGLAPAESKGSAILPRGRFPDGSATIETLDRPTPGGRNRTDGASALVVNEVHYHPLSDDPGEEFIEISNPGSGAASLEGWRIRGGVRHDFRAGETIAAGGYLVVARDPARLAAKHGLPAGTVTGPFEGSLANAGDSIRLVDPRGVTSRRVSYSDREPWPRRADGQGSSLELIHPGLDPAIAASWEASDERARAEWRTVRYEKACRPVAGRCLPEIQLMLLDEGECLVDDIEVKEPGGRTIFREDFEDGADAWVAQGTHEGSGALDDPRGGSRCYRLVASGRGGTRQNNAFATCSMVPANGRRYEVSFRALWQGGSPLLLTRFGGGGLAEVHRLDAPERSGTPGAPNSALSRAPAPAVGTPVQSPVAPSGDEPVRISVRIASVLPLAGASIFWHEEGETSWRESPLADGGAAADRFAGDGEWTGSIPSVPAGTVEFFIRAVDSAGRKGTFPIDAPRRTALYAVDLSTARPFPGAALVVSEREWTALHAGSRMSNRLRDATFVQGDSRIFYNVGFQARGSPYTRHLRYNWKVVFGSESIDSRRTWILDRQGGGARPAERLTYWLMDLLNAPAVRQRYMFLTIPGAEDGIAEDVERVDSSFLERFFGEQPAEKGALLYEVDDYIEMSDSNQMRTRIPASIALKSSDPEDYRWNFVPTGSRHPQDLQPIIALARAFDPAATSDEEFLRSFDSVADTDQWIRGLAARTLMGDWDTLSRHAGKNAFLFLHPDGRWRLLPWDCDQATQRYGAEDPIYSQDQPQFARFLSLPPYQRLYLGYLAYLAGRKLEPSHLGKILGDFRARARLQVPGIEAFLAARRKYVLAQIPPTPFEVLAVKRVPAAAGEPDVLRILGTGPVTVQRIRLLGLETAARAVSLEEWAADFPAPPPGDTLLEALDFGGDVVERATIRIP